MRYLKVTLICGVLASLLVGALYETGLFFYLDAILLQFIGRPLTPPPWHLPAQYACATVLSFALAWATIDINKLTLKIIVGVAALLEVVSGVWVLSLYGFFFSPFASLTGMVASLLFGLLYSRTTAGKRKRTIRFMFGERISNRTFHALVNSTAPLNFEGEIREASIIVCEILNRDELMDSLPVADYVALTNLFLKTGADFLVEKGGYLDECDGESLRVIFGTPLEDKDHAANSCLASLELAARLEDVNRECEARWQKMFDFRLGINSGEIVTAAYGSDRLGTFSVAGEPVEFARRLCSANLIYGSRILIGSCTFLWAADAIEVRPMEIIINREQRTREEVYELLAPKNVLTDEELHRRDMFWKGVVYYREQLFDEALEYFHQALSSNGADGPVEFYIRRTDGLRNGLQALEWTEAEVEESL